MKKFINIFILVLFSAQFVFGEYVFFIDSSWTIDSNGQTPTGNKNLETKWIEAFSLKPTDSAVTRLKTSNRFLYSNPQGMQNSAARIKAEFSPWARDQNKQDIILMGFSQGGLVARELYQQLDASDRSRVKGLITLGTPQKGSRLADKDWAWHVTGAAGVYTSLFATNGLFVFANLLWMHGGNHLEDAILGNREQGRTREILASFNNIAEARSTGKMRGRPLAELGMEYGLPLIGLLGGDVLPGSEYRDLGSLFSGALFADDAHSIRELNPSSAFLKELNSPEKIAVEQNLRRVAIMNQNGNIYDTVYYDQILPVRTFFQSIIASSSAAVRWWNPISLISYLGVLATTGVQLLLLDNANSFVSWAHVDVWGAHSSHEILVPFNDVFDRTKIKPFSAGLGMGPKRLNQRLHGKNDERDKEIINTKVSHADVPEPTAMLNATGAINGSKEGAAKQLLESFRVAGRHIGVSY